MRVCVCVCVHAYDIHMYAETIREPWLPIGSIVASMVALECLPCTFMAHAIHSPCRFANTVQLTTTTCADIIFQHGVPYYMKIDVEDATKVCLDSLGRVEDSLRPQLISAEHLDFNLTDHNRLERSLALLLHNMPLLEEHSFCYMPLLEEHSFC